MKINTDILNLMYIPDLSFGRRFFHGLVVIVSICNDVKQLEKECREWRNLGELLWYSVMVLAERTA